MKSLTLEQNARDERDKLLIGWSEGVFNFLLSRTEEKYSLKANKRRRVQLEELSGQLFPRIQDHVLIELYKEASRKCLRKSRMIYGFNSGFYSTESETVARETINRIIESNPKLKHLEVYPSSTHATDLPPNFKMIIGNYIPDFVIFGLKTTGSSAVTIEVNGDSHLDKWSKDDLRNRHLAELGIFTIDVENSQVSSAKYLEGVFLKMYRLRNGSFNAQIKRAKREIWVKTIVCHMNLNEIESFVFKNFEFQLNLINEANAILQTSIYPRKVKKEVQRLFAV